MSQPQAAISLRPPLMRRMAKFFGAHLAKILALALFVDALLIAYPLVRRVLAGEHLSWFSQGSWREIIDAIGLLDLPTVVIALGLLLMSLGLWTRARIAWAFTLVLLFPTTVISIFRAESLFDPILMFNVVLLLALIRYWSVFNRSSLAAGTLFALASFVSLIWYAMLGVLYLGEEFQPPVKDLANAAYFSVVAMSTVGFGDIVPTTHGSRLFVISVIVAGITVFATALGAVITPFVGGKLRSIIQRKARLAMRKNHVILCGTTPLARNLYKNLAAKGEAITVIIRAGAEHDYPANADIIFGDASSSDVLIEAGVKDANAVLALREDDADNAFIVLAVKSFSDSRAKTVAVVNSSQNLEKIRRVNADLVFSPQLLGAEILSRTLLGEKFDSSIIFDLSFAKPIPVEPAVTSEQGPPAPAATSAS